MRRETTLGALAAAALMPLQGCTEAEQRPNIIFFLVDDMGWQDTSVPFWDRPTRFNELYETPNMERLAAQGMLFTQAYASSVSSPSRCSMMTGANAARHRVTNWTLHKDRTTDAESDLLDFPLWNSNGITQTEGIPGTFYAKSFVQYLHDSGYRTIHCGKAHWGALDTPGEDPCHFGFDVNIAGHAAGGLATYLGEARYGNGPDGQPASVWAVPGLEDYWDTDTFATEALTREAIKALEEVGDEPFYLYMSHYAVHVPIDRDARFFEKYKAKGMSDKEAAYAALIEGMDKSLGDLMDWLEASGKAENTVIIFMSDNGGYTTGSYWRDEPLYTHNSPLRCGKGSAYEGGIREPLIVSWPGVTAPGSRTDSYVLAEDIFPTILDLAGISYDDAPQVIDGRSFVPILQTTASRPVCCSGGASGVSEDGFSGGVSEERCSGDASGVSEDGFSGGVSEERCLWWNFPNLWGETGPGIGPSCTIRKGDWKLIYFYDTGRKELYNIPRDIGEQNDLSASRPDIVADLSSKLGTFLRSCGAQRPTFKATGTPCPWPDETD